MAGRRGFTLIEVAIVVTVAAIIVTLGSLTFSGYFQRNSAHRAAQVFAQDLVMARSYALRAQESVVIRFFEANERYEVAGLSSGTEIVQRRFSGAGADIDLSAIALDLSGDSLVFSSRGVADLGAVPGSVGIARFSSGATTYRVSFNGMGASRIDQT